MTVRIVVEVVAEMRSVDEVTILLQRAPSAQLLSTEDLLTSAHMGKDDTVRAVDVERLCFRSLT